MRKLSNSICSLVLLFFPACMFQVLGREETPPALAQKLFIDGPQGTGFRSDGDMLDRPAFPSG